MRFTYIPVLLVSFFSFMKCGEMRSDYKSEPPVQEDSMATTSPAIDREESPAPSSKELLTLYPDTFTPDSIQRTVLTIYNNTDRPLSFGAHYTLHQEKDGQWEKMGLLDDIAFVDIAYGLEPEESQQMTVMLRPIEYTYSPGTYRLCKSFISEENTMEECVTFRVVDNND